jgi:hypothetical protein
MAIDEAGHYDPAHGAYLNGFARQRQIFDTARSAHFDEYAIVHQ